MFHPHNGRNGFEAATTLIDVDAIRVQMTPPNYKPQ